MLLHLLDCLKGTAIVLASGSPRRREILAALGLQFDIVPSTFAEDLDKATFATPRDYVTATALHKTQQVYRRLRSENRRVDLIIGADTIVVSHHGLILEKPRDKAHAKEMLTSLSGRTHSVLTAVVLIVPSPIVSLDEPILHSFVTETSVKFATLPEVEIDAYVASGEPLDKAGGYGIQGLGGCLVESVHGCYFNVVGFPTHNFCKELASLIDVGSLHTIRNMK